MNDASTVLYVEDDANAAFFMRFAFEEAGLKNPLQIVITGQEALDYLAGAGPFADREKYPLPGMVLLDLNLPVVPGWNVLQWIRKQPQFQSLPVIVCSASDYETDREQARRLGAQAYLVKSPSVLKLPAVIKDLIDRWMAGLP